jgi:basic membrane protein A
MFNSEKAMKKIPTVLCALIFSALLLGGCGEKVKDPAIGNVTVRLLTDSSGINDKSYNAAAWRGILEFYGDTWNDTKLRGVNYDTVVIPSEDMYAPVLRQVSGEGYDLVVTTGFPFAEALRIAAVENPLQHYMIIDVDDIELPNVLQAVYAGHEGSYLVGAAAALKARADGILNPAFGFIGGKRDSTITKFETGFVQGILSIIPDAGIEDYYLDGWDAPAFAKSQARKWYDSGLYAVYSAAGGSGLGVIAQAREYRDEGKNVWAIGVDSDQFEDGVYGENNSAVLTSMLKRIETSLVYALNVEKNGNFKGEVITFDIKADGVGYSGTNPALTADIKDRLETIRTQIASGEIVVVSTYAEAKRIRGFPQDLKAVDE